MISSDQWQKLKDQLCAELGLSHLPGWKILDQREETRLKFNALVHVIKIEALFVTVSGSTRVTACYWARDEDWDVECIETTLS